MTKTAFAILATFFAAPLILIGISRRILFFVIIIMIVAIFIIMKVADFGLSMKPSEGRRPRGEKLPVKWTSPEGLFDTDGFTSQ